MICVSCGLETDGSWTEGGLRTALCEDCFAEAFDVEDEALFDADELGLDPEEDERRKYRCPD